jgi:DNA-binding transcriptional ArsR family regulator
MDMKHLKSATAETRAQRKALTSPIRLEILGLFMGTGPLSISDMARKMGRKAGSLYHHVGLLEKAGILRQAGTRPKGKRFETLFEPVAEKFSMAAGQGDADADAQAVQAIKSAFRMTLRDFAAALASPDTVQEGPERNMLVTRIHMCASPGLLARLNDHFDALNDILQAEAALQGDTKPDGQYISLTLALLPLMGRGTERE